MKFFRYVAVVASAAMLTLAITVRAQDTAPPPPNAAPAAAAPISQDLLDSLLAPIALYPDQLLTQVLMASTYPLEVVEAARFVKANPNTEGHGARRCVEGQDMGPERALACSISAGSGHDE